MWGYIVNGTEALVHFDDRVNEIYSPRGSAQLDHMFSFGVKDKNTGEIKSELREIIGIGRDAVRGCLAGKTAVPVDEEQDGIDIRPVLLCLQPSESASSGAESQDR